MQEAFLIYEDPYDGEWDCGWNRFAEMFPELNPDKYTRLQALKIVLQRFAYRMEMQQLNRTLYSIRFLTYCLADTPASKAVGNTRIVLFTV